MPNSIEHYLFKGYDKSAAEYFVSWRKRIVAIQPNNNFTLTLDFDNGERRLYDWKPLLASGVFKISLLYQISIGRTLMKRIVCLEIWILMLAVMLYGTTRFGVLVYRIENTSSSYKTNK